jgi:hypothetical protein
MVIGTNHRVQCDKCGTVWTLEVYERSAFLPANILSREDATEYPNQVGRKAGHNEQAHLRVGERKP